MTKLWRVVSQNITYSVFIVVAITSCSIVLFDKLKDKLSKIIRSKALLLICEIILTMLVELTALIIPDIISGTDLPEPPSATPIYTPSITSAPDLPTEPLTLSSFDGDLSDYEKLRFSGAKASSELIYEGELFRASYAIDGDLDSTWQEGAAGLGIGESLTLSFPDEVSVNIIEIYPGFISSDYVFENNGRPKSLQFDFSDGSSCTYDFEDRRGAVVLKLSETVVTDYICITILDAYNAPWEDTAIAEVAAYR